MTRSSRNRALVISVPVALVVGQIALVAATPAEVLQEGPGCPGELMGVQATGVYQSRPVPDVVINGEPWAGAYWEAGMRSYWHCHAGGQLLVVWEGEGRIQRRGERMQTLHRGESSLVGPWEEHWHGAAPDMLFTHLAMSEINDKGEGTAWFEHVSDADYGKAPAPAK